MKRNQTYLILLHVADNKFNVKNVAKQNSFAMGDAEIFSCNL